MSVGAFAAGRLRQFFQFLIVSGVRVQLCVVRPGGFVGFKRFVVVICGCGGQLSGQRIFSGGHIIVVSGSGFILSGGSVQRGGGLLIVVIRCGVILIWQCAGQLPGQRFT